MRFEFVVDFSQWWASLATWWAIVFGTNFASEA